MPIGSKRGDQRLIRYTRGAITEPDVAEADNEPHYIKERLTAVRFVPLIGTHGFMVRLGP